jgi:hypothetical protein
MIEIEIIKRPKSHAYESIDIPGIGKHAIIPTEKNALGCMDGRPKLIDPNVKRPIFGGEARWAGGSAGDVLGLLATDRKLSSEDAVRIVKNHAKKEGKIFTYHEGCAHVKTALEGKHKIPVNKIEEMLFHVDQSHKKGEAKKDQHNGVHEEIALENVHGKANTAILVDTGIQVFRQDITRRDEHLTEVANTAQSMGFSVRPKKLIRKVDELVVKTLESKVEKKMPILDIDLRGPDIIVKQNGYITPRR